MNYKLAAEESGLIEEAVLQFDSYDKTFVAEYRDALWADASVFAPPVVDNEPELPPAEIILMEASEEGVRVIDGDSLTLRFNEELAVWEAIDTSRPELESIAEEFAKDLDDDLKTSLRATRENKRDVRMIALSARAPEEEVREGLYVPFLDVSSDEKCIFNGGSLALHSFELDEFHYATIDSYCMNPMSDPRDYLLDFIRYADGKTLGVCTYRVSLDGAAKYESSTDGITEEESAAVYAEWERAKPDWFHATEIRHRYDVIRAVGARSLVDPAKPYVNELDAALEAFEKNQKQDIRRNDPCPCGSGKKYKKCCGV